MARSKQAECFSFPKLGEEDAQAIKALGKGEADEFQQRLALKVIINSFSRAHDWCYVPDSLDQSAFLSGRAFVGQQILRILKIPIGKLFKEAENETKE